MPVLTRCSGGGKSTKDATAVPEDVQSGKTFYGANGKQTGIWTPKVTDFTGDATATPGEVLAGKVFYNKNGRNVGASPGVLKQTVIKSFGLGSRDLSVYNHDVWIRLPMGAHNYSTDCGNISHNIPLNECQDFGEASRILGLTWSKGSIRFCDGGFDFLVEISNSSSGLVDGILTARTGRLLYLPGKLHPGFSSYVDITVYYI